eukprot:c4570_g1_i1.p1 GENE.c4570_g1_i1~~c4570_g1_i1.p1  ORF type:complete len:401 (+),score=98.98 c4570_g1_i1:41-1243(+)
MKLDVSVVQANPNEAVLASFSGGGPRTSATLDDVSFELQTTKARRRTLVGRSAVMEYTGVNYGTNSSKKNPYGYAVGVYDKQSNSLKIVQLPDGMFTLKQTLPEAATNPEEPNRMSYIQQRNLLVTQFGAAKSRRTLQAKQANLVTSEAVSDLDNVRSALESTAASHADLLHNEVIRNIPPHDLSASTPEHAYPIDQILPKHVRAFLDFKSILRAAKNSSSLKKWQSVSEEASYVKEKAAIVMAATDKDKVLKSQILAMIGALIAMRNLGITKVADKTRLHERLNWLPRQMINHLASTFFSQDSESPMLTMDAQAGDLLIHYILVLALHLESFKVHLRDLSRDLAINTAKLRSYFRELGCEIKAVRGDASLSTTPGAQSLVATLPMPLNFPIQRKRKSQG